MPGRTDTARRVGALACDARLRDAFTLDAVDEEDTAPTRRLDCVRRQVAPIAVVHGQHGGWGVVAIGYRE